MDLISDDYIHLSYTLLDHINLDTSEGKKTLLPKDADMTNLTRLIAVISNHYGTIGRCVDSGDIPYVILIPKKGDHKMFAHEVGHALNLSHSKGNKNDAEPNPDDPDHNIKEGNLMYSSPGGVITEAQYKKFRDSKIILRP